MTGQTQAELDEYVEELHAVERSLREKYPDLPSVTIVVMAQDMLSAQHRRKKIEDGADPYDMLIMVGSFARFGFAVDLMEEGIVTRDWFFDNIAELWRGADPNDADQRFLRVWQAAWRRNKFRPVKDEPGKYRGAIPRGGRITVYRGQRMFEKPGIAWSLKREVAETFAKGASFRVPIADGIVVYGEAPASKVLAYITGRDEHEVIIDPDEVLWMGELPMKEDVDVGPLVLERDEVES